MNIIKVGCALIEKDGKVFAAQRSESMPHPLKWEFPGGKVEKDESAHMCILREIMEELGVEIRTVKRLASSTFSYPDKTVELIPFVSVICSGEINLIQHKKAKWLGPDELPAFDWVEADVAIVKAYLRYLDNDLWKKLSA